MAKIGLIKYTMYLKFYEEGKWAASQAVARYKKEYPNDVKSVDYQIVQLFLGNYQWYMDNHTVFTEATNCMASLRCGQCYVFAKYLSENNEGYDPNAIATEWFDRQGEVKHTSDFFHEHPEIKTGSGINWGSFSGIPEELVEEFKLICKEDNTQYDIRKIEDGTYSGRWHY